MKYPKASFNWSHRGLAQTDWAVNAHAAFSAIALKVSNTVFRIWISILLHKFWVFKSAFLNTAQTKAFVTF